MPKPLTINDIPGALDIRILHDEERRLEQKNYSELTPEEKDFLLKRIAVRLRMVRDG